MRARALGGLVFLAAGCGADSPDAGRTVDARAGGDAEVEVADAADAEPTTRPDAARPDAPPPGPVDPGLGALQCPPHGPFGPDVGDTLANVELVDCDGRAYTLHDLCPRDVAYVFGFAGWCAPCREFAARVPELFAAQAARGDFEMYFVVTENDDADPADADFCRTIRDTYGLEMPVLFEPAGAFPSTLGIPPEEVHLVLGPRDEILWFEHYGAAGVEAALDAAWAAVPAP